MPVEPIEAEFRSGAEAARQGRPLDRLLGRDRQTLGTWFDGVRRQSIEYAIRFSPEFLSRWLGYLDCLEAWPSHERQRRWDALRRELDGKEAFFVALAAFPKTPTLDLIESAPPDVANLGSPDGGGIRFVVHAGDARSPASARQLAFRQARDRAPILGFRWWLAVPFGGWLTPSHLRDQPLTAYSVGEWFGAWYYVEAPAIPGFSDRKLELHVHSASKRRVAEWPPTKPANPSDPKAPARPEASPEA